MAPKRKTASTHPPQGPESADDSSSSGRGRDGRLSGRNSPRAKDKAPEKGAGLLPMPGSGERSSSREQQKAVKREMDLAKVGVDGAIEGLARMERRLRRDTKRQKLKVEESAALLKENPQEDATFGPGPASLVTVKAAMHLPTPERDTAGIGCEDDGKSAPGVGDAGHQKTAEPAASGAARPPPVNSDYLPLPWKGRLGYACLNTYLRAARPSVFSSRTCRMSSIIDHRYPLQDPSKPEHSTKNRPDRTKKADPALGQRFVQGLGLANARDIPRMIRWNDKYGIRFMRLSSEMFPFASHPEHGYKLAPFASAALADAGRVAAELGHRISVHPGQFTQIASPRKEVVAAAVRDLEYHDEMLSLLRLPPQQDRDAVMIIHMGGAYGDKAATLRRFRENYTHLLSDSIKRRLVLENDDVSWSVHDLLPTCEDLNIPLVLDYHHHNIVFDPTQLKEGTKDISEPAIMQRIAATWKRKDITQKMHYSEPCAGAVTSKDRRKHSPRVATLPPCPPDMDLMIEAKDKEQAVFELMRTFKLPGFELINDLIPHEREDENRPPVMKKRKPKGRKRKVADDEIDDSGDYQVVEEAREVSAEEFGMGGPMNRVYWPPGMEDWLHPKKREIKIDVNKDEDDSS